MVPLWATVVPMVISLASAIFAFLSWRRSGATLRASQRAWVVVSKLKLPQDGLTKSADEVKLILSNDGGGPALEFQTTYGTFIGKSFEAPPSEAKGRQDARGTLGIKQKAVRGYTILLTPGQVKTVLEESTDTLFLYGHCIYKDVFDKQHKTTWCYKYVAGGKYLERHNFYNSTS